MASPLVPIASQGSTTTIPVSAPMPEQRAQAFMCTLAARLRLGAQSGIPFDTMVTTLVLEQQAMSAALQNPAFIETMATAFQQAMAQQQGNPAYALPIEEARREVRSILNNRVQDAHNFAALIVNPAFLKQAVELSHQPTPSAGPYQLPPNKSQEIIRRLVQPNDAEGPEPAVHVAASAIGQRIIHQALANIFAPDGVLHKPLMQALQAAAPTMAYEAIHQQTLDWLAARQGPAQAVANGLTPGGAEYATAMQMAEALQRKPAPPAMQIAMPPVPQIVAPIQHTPLRPRADLLMDTI